MTPSDLITAFFDTGLHLAALVTPYALHLTYLLIFVELLTIGITWVMGSDDSPELLWRILRLVFIGWFAWWWIQNAWPLGTSVMGSFDIIGRNISASPGGLVPSQFFDVAIRIAKMLWNSPSSHRLLPDLGLDVLEGLLIVVIMLLLGLLAAVAAFSLIAAYLIIGPGSIFVAFMPCRFTSTLSENYFVWLVRTGALLLGFYVVLATCQHFAALWNTALAGICSPIGTTLPVPFLGGPPTASAAVTCTHPIPVASLITLFMDVLLLAVVGLTLPFILASMAGNGVHLGLENLASARYLAGGVARPVAKAIGGLAHQVQRSNQNSSNKSTLQQRLTAGAAAAAAHPPKPPAQNAYGVQSTQALPQNGAKPTTQI